MRGNPNRPAGREDFLVARAHDARGTRQIRRKQITDAIREQASAHAPTQATVASAHAVRFAGLIRVRRRARSETLRIVARSRIPDAPPVTAHIGIDRRLLADRCRPRNLHHDRCAGLDVAARIKHRRTVQRQVAADLQFRAARRERARIGQVRLTARVQLERRRVGHREIPSDRDVVPHRRVESAEPELRALAVQRHVARDRKRVEPRVGSVDRLDVIDSVVVEAVRVDGGLRPHESDRAAALRPVYNLHFERELHLERSALEDDRIQLARHRLAVPVRLVEPVGRPARIPRERTRLSALEERDNLARTIQRQRERGILVHIVRIVEFARPADERAVRRRDGRQRHGRAVVMPLLAIPHNRTEAARPHRQLALDSGPLPGEGDVRLHVDRHRQRLAAARIALRVCPLPAEALIARASVFRIDVLRRRERLFAAVDGCRTVRRRCLRRRHVAADRHDRLSERVLQQHRRARLAMPDIVCVSRIVGVHATLHVDEVRPRRGDRVIHILRHDEQVVARARLVERVDLLGARRARHDRDTPAAASIGAAVLVRPPAARMNDRLLARRELGARDPDAAAGTGVIARVLVVAARHVNLAVQRHLAARRKAHRAAALAESVRTVSARRTRIERRIRPAIGLCVAAAAVARTRKLPP